MKADSVIKGRVVTLKGIYSDSAIVIKDGKVVDITHKTQVPAAKEDYDYGDLIILPGVVDNHVHSLGVKEEGHWNSTSSAAAGGVTTINDHPLDLGGAPTNSEKIKAKAEKTSKEAVVDFSLLSGGLSEKLDDVKEVAECGITGYKVLMHSTSGSADYGMRGLNDAELYAMFEAIAETNQPAMVHAENELIIEYLVNKWQKEGKMYPAAHCETRPVVTETMAVSTAIEIARALNCRLHIVHISVPRSFALIQAARNEGLPVTGETCPHFLICNNERWKEVGADYKINPPLRSEENRLLLWKLLREGKIDLIASDHAPHTPNTYPNIFDNFSGNPGVETILPLVFSEGVNKGQIGFQDLVRLLSYNPALLLGIYPQKGMIQIGSDADIVVFDPKKKWRVEGKNLHSQSGWTMFEGIQVTGKVNTTFVRGKRVFVEGEVLGEKGFGKWIKRKYFYDL